MFTPKQAAEILNIPASTLRRYRLQWSDYLSAPDERRRYTQEDLDTLRLIRDLIGQRKTQDEIAAILLQGPEPFVFENEIPPESKPRSAIQSIEFFSQVIDQLTAEHQTALTAKDGTILAKDETINGLRSDKDRLQMEINWLRLPWYRRIFKSPPE